MPFATRIGPQYEYILLSNHYLMQKFFTDAQCNVSGCILFLQTRVEAFHKASCFYRLMSKRFGRHTIFLRRIMKRFGTHPVFTDAFRNVSECTLFLQMRFVTFQDALWFLRCLFSPWFDRPVWVHRSTISSTRPYSSACSAGRTCTVPGGRGSQPSGKRACARQKRV